MSYLNYDGLAYFKSKLTNWVDQNYLSKTNTGNTTVAGNVTFTNPITGDLDGKAKKDWLGQKIDETYIKSIATNDNAGTIVYTKGNGSTNHILIDILQGATPVANGRAGLVPAPTVSEMNYFLRGDGNWAVPTDVYVNQNLIASSNNNQFPVLLSGTSGTPATKTNATVGYTNVVSVNPLTNALMASQFISKHSTYNRQSAVTSKVQYSLNFTDIVSGAGHNLGEVVGYVDTVANGGEHELGLRLFGNPNVQGTEEDYVYMGVGLSKTNVAYGHAPSTPLPSAHNEPTDIITRDWLARNGSETGLVHTSMNETIGGIKTFTDETRNTSTAGITTTKLTASGKITGTGTAEISGGSGNTPSLKVTGNETVTGDLSVGGSETVAGNETVGGTLTVTGKITGNGGAEISGGNGLKVNGNETVTGKLTAEDLEATDDLTVGDTATIGGTILKKTGTNTTQEYVSYITNQESSRTTIINNMADTYTIKNNNSKLSVDLTNARATDLAKITAALVQTGGGLVVDPTTKKLKVTFEDPDPNFIKGVVEGMIDKDSNGNFVGGLSTNPTTGKLIVDFSQIDENTKKDILSNLDMQVPLNRNMTFYVDQTHVNKGDSIIEGRGTENLPFEHIQDCVTYVTTLYSLNTHSITIRVKAGTYVEHVRLPQFDATSGYIRLESYSGLRDVTIEAPVENGFTTYCISATGTGTWQISNMLLRFHAVLGEVPLGGKTNMILSSSGGGRVNLRGIKFVLTKETGSFTATGTDNFHVRVVSADTGDVWFYPSPVNFEFEVVSAPTDHMICDVLAVQRGGNLYLVNSYDQTADFTIPCSGSCSCFARLFDNGAIKPFSTGNKFTFSGSNVTGQSYFLSTGSYINGAGSATYFPGDTEGTIQEGTCCWYK